MIGPPTEGHTTHALVDTGATQSCIDIQIAQSLGLPVVDTVMIAGAAGPYPHPLYAARVAIPTLEIFHFGAFAGVDLAAGEQPHRVLLGRTFLQGTVMTREVCPRVPLLYLYGLLLYIPPIRNLAGKSNPGRNGDACDV